MSTRAWIVRFLLAFSLASAALAMVQLVKGATVDSALVFAGEWGAITAVVFTGVGYLKYRRRPGCMVNPGADR